jgi:hypothetical protein
MDISISPDIKIGLDTLKQAAEIARYMGNLYGKDNVTIYGPGGRGKQELVIYGQADPYYTWHQPIVAYHSGTWYVGFYDKAGHCYYVNCQDGEITRLMIDLCNAIVKVDLGKFIKVHKQIKKVKAYSPSIVAQIEVLKSRFTHSINIKLIAEMRGYE